MLSLSPKITLFLPSRVECWVINRVMARTCLGRWFHSKTFSVLNRVKCIRPHPTVITPKMKWLTSPSRTCIQKNLLKKVRPSSLADIFRSINFIFTNYITKLVMFENYWTSIYRLVPVNSKSFVGKVFLQIKWKFELQNFLIQILPKTLN